MFTRYFSKDPSVHCQAIRTSATSINNAFHLLRPSIIQTSTHHIDCCACFPELVLLYVVIIENYSTERDAWRLLVNKRRGKEKDQGGKGTKSEHREGVSTKVLDVGGNHVGCGSNVGDHGRVQKVQLSLLGGKCWGGCEKEKNGKKRVRLTSTELSKNFLSYLLPRNDVRWRTKAIHKGHWRSDPPFLMPSQPYRNISTHQHC